MLPQATDVLDYEHMRAVRWYLRGNNHPILINPLVAFGRPTLAGLGIPTRSIDGRYQAGDSKQIIADDRDLMVEQVEEALWFERSLRAA